MDFVPLLFPLASGFRAARSGRCGRPLPDEPPPRAGAAAGWGDAFGVVAPPAFGAIVVLGLLLLAIFLLWLMIAYTDLPG